MLTIFLLSIVSALATGLGALPLIGNRSASPKAAATGTALAAGGMIGASVLLIGEGARINLGTHLIGIIIGITLVTGTNWILKRHVPEHTHLGSLRKIGIRRAILIITIMTVHSAAEGIGMGVAFGQGAQFGILVSVSMLIHNAFEGLAISMSLVPRGVSVGQAAAWSIFTSIPQVFLALPAFLLVEIAHPLLSPGLGLAAGAMLWMCLTLIPEARQHIRISKIFGLIVIASTIMIGIERLL
jgi:zinc transporter, ZIP family